MTSNDPDHSDVEKMDLTDDELPEFDTDDEDLVDPAPNVPSNQNLSYGSAGEEGKDRREEFLKKPLNVDVTDNKKRKLDKIKDSKKNNNNDNKKTPDTTQTNQSSGSSGLDPPPGLTPLGPSPLTPTPKPIPTPKPTPKPAPTPTDDQNGKKIPRPRQYITEQYTEGSQTEWVVFFRPKQKPLNFIRITNDLMNHYSGLVQCTKLNKSKLRVVVDNAKQANEIVKDQRFCLEYRVWIPAHKVEIDGVVTDDGLTEEDLSKAVGRFKNPKLPSVEILECRQLGNVTGEGDQKKFVPSASFRVTFAGSALPDYIELYKLRLPVRLYIPRVMSCSNCQQLGHTKTYCSNKSKCSKCAGPHKDVDCQKQAEKCQLCGGEPHKTRQCPKYKEREDKMKRSLKERSKKSFAEILKNSNRFAALAEQEEEDEDTDEELLFEREEESDTSSRSSGPKQKRQKTASGGKGKQKGGKLEEDFPPLNPTPPMPNPNPPNPAPIPTKSTRKPLKPQKQVEPNPMESLKGLVSFSTIVEWLCSLVSEPIGLLIKQFEPMVRNIGKQLASSMPLLSIISFDG